MSSEQDEFIGLNDLCNMNCAAHGAELRHILRQMMRMMKKMNMTRLMNKFYILEK